jgi:uncharacterized Zn finger protein (UPF0148 family)
LAAKRWPDGIVVCPICGRTGAGYLANQKRWQCSGRQYGFRAETQDHHKTVKSWFQADACMARIIEYRNSPPAENQTVVRQYLGDYAD